MITVLDRLESNLVDLATRFVPLLAPAPTAYLVGRATVNHLGWPVVIGVCSALVVESLGLAATNTALSLYTFNQSRRKTDPAAPFGLALAVVGFYFLIAISLTILLDIFSGAAVFAPVVFPMLSLAGVAVVALRADHRRRLTEIDLERQNRKLERQARSAENHNEPSKSASKSPNLDPDLSRLQAGQKRKLDARLDMLQAAFIDNPHLTPTEAARHLGTSRQTIYSYIERLESAGRIRRNGHGVEIAR